MQRLCGPCVSGSVGSVEYVLDALGQLPSVDIFFPSKAKRHLTSVEHWVFYHRDGSVGWCGVCKLWCVWTGRRGVCVDAVVCVWTLWCVWMGRHGVWMGRRGVCVDTVVCVCVDAAVCVWTLWYVCGCCGVCGCCRNHHTVADVQPQLPTGNSKCQCDELTRSVYQ